MPVGAFRNTTDGATFPAWTCLVDGGINSANNFNGPTTQWSLCEYDSLPDGQHILSLQIEVSEGQQFWFDYMQYAPSDTVPLDDATIYIDSTDSAVFYGTGWIDYDSGRGEEAIILGTDLTLKFYGMYLCELKFTSLESWWLFRNLRYMGRDHSG